MEIRYNSIQISENHSSLFGYNNIRSSGVDTTNFRENTINTIDKRPIPRNVIDNFEFYEMHSYKQLCLKNVLAVRVTLATLR